MEQHKYENIICPIVGDLDIGEAPILYHLPHSPNFADCKTIMRGVKAMENERRWNQDPELNGISYPVNGIDRLEKFSSKIEAKWDLDIAQILLENRVRLSFLIDSQGGRTFQRDRYIDLINFIKVRGGKVDAYASKNAKSAAADIFLEADNRFCLYYSAFMWHCSRWEDPGKWGITDDMFPIEFDEVEERERVEKSQMEEIRAFRTKLLAECKHHKLDLGLRLLSDIDFALEDGKSLEDIEVNLYGNSLDKTGIAISFSDLRMLYATFLERTGLSYKQFPSMFFFLDQLDTRYKIAQALNEAA